MVTINEEIGFRVLDQWRFWEIDVSLGCVSHLAALAGE